MNSFIASLNFCFHAGKQINTYFFVPFKLVFKKKIKNRLVKFLQMDRVKKSLKSFKFFCVKVVLNS